MSGDKYDWVGVFTAIEAAMSAAAAQRSAEVAGSEAERHGLTKHGDPNATYQDKVWEKTADGLTLHLKWHCYDQSHAYRAYPDMNVLLLELRRGAEILRRAEQRFQD